MYSNDFCYLCYHHTRKIIQEKGTIFITIIKSSLNKKNMRNGLHLSHDGISLLNILMIVNETLTSFLINPAILADIK